MAVISRAARAGDRLALLAWVLALRLAAALSRGAVARPAVRLIGIAVIYLPLLLLVGAALEPGECAELAAGRCSARRRSPR